MRIVGAEVAVVEAELAGGLLGCPSCGGVLGPWGHARERVLRCRDGDRQLRASQQPVARISALQTWLIFASSRRVMDSTSSARGTVRRLSSVTAHSTGMPSAGPSCTSDGIPRTVRVTKATVTLRRPGMASSRVRTTAGLRPSSASSSQQTSPRATKAPRGSPLAHWKAPTHPRSRPGLPIQPRR